MIRYRRGDLFASGLPVIGHGCNCRGVMGKGIAAGFRQRWPAMYNAYRKQCLAGGFWPGDVMTWETGDPGATGIIFNLATQLETGADATMWAVTAAVGRMIGVAHRGYGITEIGLPMIGCGIGGLNAADLRTCLRPFTDAPVDLTVFEYEEPR